MTGLSRGKMWSKKEPNGSDLIFAQKVEIFLQNKKYFWLEIIEEFLNYFPESVIFFKGIAPKRFVFLEGKMSFALPTNTKNYRYEFKGKMSNII